MKRSAIIEVASLLGIGAPARLQPSPQWVAFHCPFAKWTHSAGTDRKPAFGIHIAPKGTSHYSCFACHQKGSVVGMAYKLARYRKTENWGAVQEIAAQIEQIELLGTAIILRPYGEKVFDDDEDAPKAAPWVPPPRDAEFRYPLATGHWYLRDRGIDVVTSIRLRIRYDEHQRRVLFPLYSTEGRFAGFSGRRIDPPFGHDDEGPLEQDGSRYIKVRDYFGLPKRRYFLGGHANERRVRYLSRQNAWRSYASSIQKPAACFLIGEGAFDYAALTRMGAGYALANLGSALTDEKVQFLKNANLPIVNFFDNDDGGKLAWSDLCKKLWGHVPLLDTWYPEGYEDADPATTPPDVLMHMFRNRELVLAPPVDTVPAVR